MPGVFMSKDADNYVGHVIWLVITPQRQIPFKIIYLNKIFTLLYGKLLEEIL